VSVNLLNVTNFSYLFKKYDISFMFVKAIAPRGQREVIAQRAAPKAIAKVTLNP